MNTPKGFYAWTVKVGDKGQIVIPKEARDAFDIHPGDTLLLLGDEKRGLSIPLKSELARITAQLMGAGSEEEEQA